MQAPEGQNRDRVFVSRRAVNDCIGPEFRWTRGGKVIFHRNGAESDGIRLGTMSAGADDGLFVDPDTPSVNGELRLFNGCKVHEETLRAAINQALREVLDLTAS